MTAAKCSELAGLSVMVKHRRLEQPGLCEVRRQDLAQNDSRRRMRTAIIQRAASTLFAIWAAIESARMIGAPSAAGMTAVIVLLAALLSSIVGFAFSALAGSALAYLRLEPSQAVMTMAICSIAIQLYAVWKLRDSIRWRSLWPMLAAGAATVPAGVWLLIHIDRVVYVVSLGVLLTGYGCHLLLRREGRVFQGNAWLDVLAGALGGLAGGLAALPGSFVTVWCSMRGWDKLQQRAVYQPYILVMQFVTIGCLALLMPNGPNPAANLSFVPFALIGAVAGLSIFQRLSNRQFQTSVSLLLILSGVGLLAQEVGIQ